MVQYVFSRTVRTALTCTDKSVRLASMTLDHLWIVTDANVQRDLRTAFVFKVGTACQEQPYLSTIEQRATWKQVGSVISTSTSACPRRAQSPPRVQIHSRAWQRMLIRAAAVTVGPMEFVLTISYRNTRRHAQLWTAW